MKVLYTPQFNPIDKLSYEFDGEQLAITLNGQSVTVDLTQDEIQTNLPIEPIIQVMRTDGELSLVLLNFHSNNASEKELYPEWVNIVGEV